MHKVALRMPPPESASPARSGGHPLPLGRPAAGLASAEVAGAFIAPPSLTVSRIIHFPRSGHPRMNRPALGCGIGNAPVTAAVCLAVAASADLSALRLMT